MSCNQNLLDYSEFAHTGPIWILHQSQRIGHSKFWVQAILELVLSLFPGVPPVFCYMATSKGFLGQQHIKPMGRVHNTHLLIGHTNGIQVSSICLHLVCTLDTIKWDSGQNMYRDPSQTNHKLLFQLLAICGKGAHEITDVLEDLCRLGLQLLTERQCLPKWAVITRMLFVLY